MTHRIVIVGGGAGGLELATRLGRTLGKRKRASIVLVDATLTHIWKPLLHEVAAGSLNSSEDELNYVAQGKWNHFEFQLGRMSGLAELKGASGFSPVAALGAGQVVFNLAPRINAAGRLGSPTLAHDMLLTPSHDEAAKLAQTLTSLNDERRSEEDRIYKEALEQAEANPKRLGFVLYRKDWHQGVIGIVASRIVEVYYRPVLILCSDGESLKGSGRSVPEFDLHAGLTRCADMLLGFGGHRH